jgi:hypothetical protein
MSSEPLQKRVEAVIERKDHIEKALKQIEEVTGKDITLALTLKN